MKYLWGIAFSVVISFLGVGLLLLTTAEPRGDPIQLSPPPTPAPIIVHVTGAVINPGVYSLPSGSRVGDAINLANGLVEEADASLINLARILADGEQIWVPYLHVETGADQVQDDLEILPVEITRSLSPSLININTATQSELESLSGIGPKYAQAIIQYRLENGPFESIEEIQAVKGIGPVTFEKIRQFITIRGPTGN